MRNRNRRWAMTLVAAGVFALLAVLVCGPPVLAAESVDCSMCHEDTAKAFQATVHGRLRGFETPTGEVGCTTCHGDGAKHAEEGDPTLIRTFDPDTPMEDLDAVCLKCHRSGALHDWEGSTHQMMGVGCTDCHTIHGQQAGATPSDPDTCYRCHEDVRAEFQYPSHHPLREGHMTCDSCHTPHGGSVGLLRNEERPSELCYTCHTELQGPFIFEHEPVAEGCDTCHTPHGSVANNLLVQNEPFLCLQCHEFHFHAGLDSWEETEVYVPRFDPANGATDGNTYPGGMVPNPFGTEGMHRAFTTKCTQCHTHVHGTDLPSQTVPGLGRGLTR